MKAQLTKVVLEVRFDDGELYWDLSGRVRRTLFDLEDAWEFAGTPEKDYWQGRFKCDGEEGPFAGIPVDILFAFGARKADLVIVAKEPIALKAFPRAQFLDLAGRTLSRTLDALTIEKVTRIGLRSWTLFEQASREEAIATIAKCRFAKTLAVPQCGNAITTSATHLFRKSPIEVRVSIGDGTVDYHKTAKQCFGTVLDIDTYRTESVSQRKNIDEHVSASQEIVDALTAEVLESLK